MTILFCIKCNEGYRSSGVIPTICPCCGKPTAWSTTPRIDVPSVPWLLTEHDKVFLKVNRIAPGEEFGAHLRR